MAGSSAGSTARAKSRDIAKVLRKLVQPGVGLFAMRDADHRRDEQAVRWCLGKKVSGAAGKLQNIPDHLIFELRSRDLIQAAKRNHWKISPAGLAWLKRHLSGSDPFQAQQMQV
ncbi:MAG: hypothetical protein K8F25_06735, partial [Fimbriimonadaceae bacterium]|nr:hypothetical protein [Alphaproteobacteria bacterium]